MNTLTAILYMVVACVGVQTSCAASKLRRLRSLNDELTCKPGRTQTQGGWLGGSGCKGNNPSCYNEANFDIAFPSGFILGEDSNNWIVIDSYENSRLINQGGTPTGLPGACTGCAVQSCDGGCDVTNPSDKNNLLSQTLALSLNVGYDNCSRFGSCALFCTDCTSSDTPLADRVLVTGECTGETVQQVLDTAQCVLGNYGNCGYSASAITSCVDLINNNYVDGDSDNGNLDCNGTLTSQPTTNPTISTPSPTISTPSPTISTPSPTISTPSPTISTPSPTSALFCDPANLGPPPFPPHTNYYFVEPLTPRITINNLGGYCGNNADPINNDCGEGVDEIIRIEDAGFFQFDLGPSDFVPVTVEVAVAEGASYIPSSQSVKNAPNEQGAGYNGLLGENGQINLHLDESTELVFSLKNGNTGEPLEVPRDAQGNQVGVLSLEMTIYDIDMGVLSNAPDCTECSPRSSKVNPSEGCSTCQCKGGRDVLGVHVIPSQDVQFSFYDGVPTSICREDSTNLIQFWADIGETNGGSNNPTQPYEDGLTEFQKEVAVNLIFTDTNNVTLMYKIDEPTGTLNYARNIVFNLFAQRRDCSPTLAPTTAP